MTHYHIYLGRERGKRTIHKVGLTTQTCWARCHSSDYLIGMSYEIIFPVDMPRDVRRECLYEAEDFIIERFNEMFTIVHGNEYFRTTKKQWPEVREIFATEMTDFLIRKGWGYEVHEGWVGPHTY